MPGEPSADGSFSRARTPWIAIVALLAVVALTFSFIDVASWGEWSPDFVAYRNAALRLRTGQLIYEDPGGEITSPKAYIYPPTFAAVYAPLTYFPLGPGAALWAALHFLFAAVLFGAVLRLVPEKVGAWQFGAMLLCALLVPFTQEMREGQVNLAVNMIIAAALVSLKNGHEGRAGALLALAAHLKVIPVVLLPILFLCGKKKAGMRMALFLVVFALLPLVWTIPNHGPVGGVQELIYNYIDFLDYVVFNSLSTSRPGGYEQFYIINNSSHAVVHRLFGEGTLVYAGEGRRVTGALLFALPPILLKILGFGLPLAMYCLAAFAAWKRRAHYLMAAVLALLSIQFMNLLFWEHHLLALVLLCGLLLHSGMPLRRAWAAIAILGAAHTLPFVLRLLLIPFGTRFADEWLLQARAWSLPTLGFLVLWWAGLALLRKAPAAQEPPRPDSPAASAGGG